MGRPVVGQYVDGIDIPVVNERAMRAAAGILFVLGFTAYLTALLTGFLTPLRGFGMLFAVDLFVRLFVGSRYAPSLVLGKLAVRGQLPEWVGAAQKTFAWSLGLGMSLLACFAMGWLGWTVVALALCGVCLALLFLESAFGICVGCELKRRFGRTAPRLCPGGTCPADAKATPPSS